MKTTPTKMVADLANFIQANHEDAAYPYESLYVELLKQWRVLSRFQPRPADQMSQQLYQAYWQAMQRWYQIFNQQRAELMEPAALPSAEMMDFYIKLVDDQIAHVQSLLPPSSHQTVIRIDDFRILLSQQLTEFTKLQLDEQGPLDFAMLIDYWRLLGDALDN